MPLNNRQMQMISFTAVSVRTEIVLLPADPFYVPTHREERIKKPEKTVSKAILLIRI